jgi:hypothetical protein
MSVFRLWQVTLSQAGHWHLLNKIYEAVVKMTLLEIFEKVNLVIPLEQRRFFNFFDDTVNELVTLYRNFVLEEGEYTPPKDLSDSVKVLPLYHNAIVDNILFIAGQGDAYKSEFIRKSKLAYLQYWNDNAKGKRVKRMRW